MTRINLVRDNHVSRSLAPLSPVFNQWQKIMGDPEWLDYGDAPWWYNEQASISCFAGAIWKSRGWAFEEAPTPRSHTTERGKRVTRTGHCDILFGLGKYQFIAEAKHCYPRIAQNMQKGVELIERRLQEATKQVPRWGSEWRRLAMVFAAPGLPTKGYKDNPKALQLILSEFISQLMKIDNVALSWAFPMKARTLESKRYDSIYPGAILIMRSL
jgi:hypothetical protein